MKLEEELIIVITIPPNGFQGSYFKLGNDDKKLRISANLMLSFLHEEIKYQKVFLYAIKRPIFGPSGNHIKLLSVSQYCVKTFECWFGWAINMVSELPQTLAYGWNAVVCISIL